MRRKLLNKTEISEVIELLIKQYPDAKAELNFSNPFELLVATILSAQCTDVRVNKVTENLFQVLSQPSDIKDLTIGEIEDIIQSCGLYKTKAKNIYKTAEILLNDYDGKVPEDIKTLVQLPGVGQKTANVVVSNAFGIPAIAVDTHVQRVSNRLGLVVSKDVKKTERDLEKRLPRELWTQMHHTLIFHGRYHCKARKPLCETCVVAHLCMDKRKREE